MWVRGSAAACALRGADLGGGAGRAGRLPRARPPGRSPGRGHGPGAPSSRSGGAPAATVPGRPAELRRGPLPQRPVRVHVVHVPAALPALGARLQLPRRGPAAAARPGGRRAVYAPRGLRGRPRRRPLRPLRPSEGLAPGRHRLRPAVLPLHLQPVPGLRGRYPGVGRPPLLRALHRDLPVRLGRYADRPPQSHPGARHQRPREGGAHGPQVRLHRGGQHHRVRCRLAAASPAGLPARGRGPGCPRPAGRPRRAGVPEPVPAGGRSGRRLLAAVPRGHEGRAPAAAGGGARRAQPAAGPAHRPAPAALETLAAGARLLSGGPAVHEHEAHREPVPDVHSHVPHLLAQPAQEVHRHYPAGDVRQRILLVLPHEAGQQVHREEPDLLRGPPGDPGLRRLGGAGRQARRGRVRSCRAAGHGLCHDPRHLAGHDGRPHRPPHAQRSLCVWCHELLGQGGQRAGGHGHPELASLLLGALLPGLRRLLPLGDGGCDWWRGRGRHPLSVQSPDLAHPPAELGPRSLTLTPSPHGRGPVHVNSTGHAQLPSLPPILTRL